MADGINLSFLAGGADNLHTLQHNAGTRLTAKQQVKSMWLLQRWVAKFFPSLFMPKDNTDAVLGLKKKLSERTIDEAHANLLLCQAGLADLKVQQGKVVLAVKEMLDFEHLQRVFEASKMQPDTLQSSLSPSLSAEVRSLMKLPGVRTEGLQEEAQTQKNVEAGSGTSSQDRSMDVPGHLYRPGTTDPKRRRFVDNTPVKIKPDVLKENKAQRSAEQLDELEYRVEPDHLRVQEKIQRENSEAQKNAKQQEPNDRFIRGAMDPQAKPDIGEHSSKSCPNLQGAGVSEAQGIRENMQDAHLATQFTFNSGDKPVNVSLTGVFDGHGVYGFQASSYAANEIVKHLQHRLAQYNPNGLTEAGIWNALKLALVDLNRSDFYTQPGVKHAGTTANLALVIGGRLWVANTGDSRAMLSFPDGRSLALSDDAKPKANEFQYGNLTGYQPLRFLRSVIKRGGDGNGKRVYNPKTGEGRISTGRALGDTVAGGILPARPKITSYPLDEVKDATLVQGCDGVFDVATNDQVSQLVQDCLADNPAASTESIASQIVTKSYQAGSTDNITALVVPVAAMET